MDSLQLLKTAVKSADDKKAYNLKVLDIRELTTLADYFVICHGTSFPQMRAIFDEVEEKLKEQEVLLQNAGAEDSNQWMLMDYGDVIVHVMQQEIREFYAIERLWDDAGTQNEDN